MKMKMYGIKAAIAAALGVCLIGGEMLHAQGKGKGKRDRDNRGRKTDNRGQKTGKQGRQVDNRGRGGIQIGRRYDRNQLRTNRSGYYRQRSQVLGSQLRIGIGGVRIGVGTTGGVRRIDNDWQRWNSDHYARHSWRRGSWQGAWYQSYDSRWRQSWRRYPVAVSLGATPWGFNRMGYWFGYNSYHNPYYSRPVVIGTTTIDYSQPLVAAPPEYEDDKTTLAEFDQAREAFKRRQYDRALAAVNLAIVKQPRDATLHEFRALVLFVMADYHEAAATLNPVLAVGPGWDWATLRGLYSSVAEYTKHLRALEGYVREHKERPFGHFLLGYHYLTAGHADAARTQLQRAVALAPKDEVAKNLLTMLDKDAKIPEPSITLPGQGSKVTSGELVGNWNAKRGNEEFGLKLEKDMSFEWVHREGKRSTKVTGTYAYEKGTLALEPQDGGVMLATVGLKGADRLQFRMVGADAKDSGLTFSR